MKSNIKLKILLIIILLLELFIRLYRLDADPPVNLEIQFISDEGWWVHNPRNKVLFGKFILDDFNQSLFISPTFCMLTTLSFYLFGVGFFQARLVSAIFGFLTILYIAYKELKRGRIKYAIIISLLLGLDYSFLCLNRTAFVDTLMMFFLIISFYKIKEGIDNIKRVFISGIFFGLAFCTKSYSLFFPFIVLIFLFNQYKLRIKTILRYFGIFLIGTFIILLIWILAILLPNWDIFKIMYYLWGKGNAPQSILYAIKNIGGFVSLVVLNRVKLRNFFILSYPLVFLSWISGIYLLFYYFSKTKNRISLEIKLWLIWFVIAMIFILPLIAKPLRRYIIIIFPLVFFIKHWLEIDKFRIKDLKIEGIIKKLFLSLTIVSVPVIYITPFIVNKIGLILTRKFSKVKIGSAIGVHLSLVNFLTLALLLFSLTTFVFFTLRFLKRIFIDWNKLTAIFIYVIINVFMIISMFRNTTYSLKETSIELSKTLFKEGTVVFGSVSDTLCLEGKAFAFTYWGRQELKRFLNQNPIERFDPDYIVVARKFDYPWPVEKRYKVLIEGIPKVKTLKLLPINGKNYRVIVDIYRRKNKIKSFKNL